MISRTGEPTGAFLGVDSSASGVSWGAILAGAFAAAALSFILIILGFGLGFSAVSPWSGSGASAQTIGISTVVWLAFTQIAASAIGGFLAGRLRVKWAGVHSDEVYFRDTAHGFLAWAVASLATAALLTSAIGGVLSGGAKVAGAVGTTGAAVATAAGVGAGSGGMQGMGDISGYFIDSMFRPANPSSGAGAGALAAADSGTAGAGMAGMPGATGMSAMPAADNGNGNGNAMMNAQQRAETTRIFANALRTGSLSSGDRSYLAQILAKRNGISQADAEKRVNEIYAGYAKAIEDGKVEARAAADKARKAAAYSALWMFVALLCGAFVASLSATFGGRLRDRDTPLDDTPVNTYSSTAPTL